MKFSELGLLEPLLKAVSDEGYISPTPIQEKAIPYILKGHDLFGRAQTGTGKTAAFALPILQHILENPSSGKPRPIRALVVAPTRELAVQINESFIAYARHTKLRSTVAYGGVSTRPQADAVRAGVDILIATPGRLLDLMGQRVVDLSRVDVLVLDEADRMLDMGFIRDIRQIVAAIPRKRQTLFLSATIPADIKRLAGDILHDPVEVSVAAEYSTVDETDQYVYFVEKYDKLDLMLHLLAQPEYTRVLVFTSTKYGADKLERSLQRAGVKGDAIHGNKSQKQREKALERFKAGATQVLVATDVASRGIDIEEVSHVVNYDLPEDTESYIHRIGRTGRAGLKGAAVAFCERGDRANLVNIERLIHRHIEVIEEHPFKSFLPAPLPSDLNLRGRSVARGGGGRGKPKLAPSRGKTQPFPTGPSGGGYSEKPRPGYGGKPSGGYAKKSGGPGERPGGYGSKRSGGPERPRDSGPPRKRKPGDGKNRSKPK